MMVMFNILYNANLSFIIVFGLVSLQSFSHGYNVLVLGPSSGKSVVLFTQNFVKTLLERSHNVTFITSTSMKLQKIANYTEILIDPPFNFSSTFPSVSVEERFHRNDKSPFMEIFELLQFTAFRDIHSLSVKNVRNFIKQNDLNFDVVINEEFFHDSFSMFGYRFNAPVITICPYGNSDFFDRRMGHLTPWSHVPHWLLPYTDDMTFAERWHNTVVSAYDALLRYFYHYPIHNQIAQTHFGHLGPLPTIEEITRNVSLILVNTHRSLSHPRPTMPSIINIGGSHIKPVKPLPANIKKFLDGAKDGAIFFSLGTMIQSSKIQKDKIQSFLSVFRKLQQRILWKFEDDSLTDVPSNVLIQKWMPQNDILAHPNVKLFISHGGLFGTFESLAHSVPMIVIPFFGDQKRNAMRIVNAGYGKILEFKNINEDILSKTLHEVLTNDAYSAKAKELSALFNHNLVHPMDEAMFWIEYVAKFKGAKHLKSHALNMSWFSYLLLDVIIVTLLGVFACIYALVYLARKVCCIKKMKNVSVSDKKGN